MSEVMRVGEDSIRLEDLLSEIKGEGRLDSSGKFTLDIASAAPKLQRFLLRDPYYYALKLVQGSVAGGTARINVDCNNHRVRVRWGGRIPEREDLQSLFAFLFEETEPVESRHLRHLAAGINTAVVVGARRMWLDCWDGRQGFSHCWSSGGWSQSEGAQGDVGAPCVTFNLLRGASDVARGWWNTGNCDVFDLIRGSRATMDQEQAAVYDRCPYAPVPVLLNGRPVNNFVFGEARFPGYDIHQDPNPGATGLPWWVRLSDPKVYVHGVCHRRHHLVERHVRSERPSPSDIPAPLDSQATILTQMGDFPAGVRVGCSALLGIEADMKPRARVTFLEDGVTLCQEHLELGVRGAVALVSVEGLKRDLSGFSVVHDAAYRERTEWLRAQFQEMSQAMERSDRIPARFG